MKKKSSKKNIVSIDSRKKSTRKKAKKAVKKTTAKKLKNNPVKINKKTSKKKENSSSKMDVVTIHAGRKPLLREFVDINREVMDEFFDIMDVDTFQGSLDEVKRSLKKLILKDPCFLDPYKALAEIYLEEDLGDQSDKIMDRAYAMAMDLILDEKGNWPDRLHWGYIENRHIIRTISEKGIILWLKGENTIALDLFRRLLTTNPNDNPGVRYYMLAILMGIDFPEFMEMNSDEDYVNSDIDHWFQENHTKFPGEFDGLFESELMD